MPQHFPATRLRRLRQSEPLRALVKEMTLNPLKLVYPLFIKQGIEGKVPISSMPGQFQFSLKALESEIVSLASLGIKNVLLFGIPTKKDALGQDSYNDNGIVQQAIAVIKRKTPQMLVISDLCFCEYTDHGHCGVIIEKNPNKKNEDNFEVDNDQTLEHLCKQALSHARAGADVVAPSGNMDGMVGAIRKALDEGGFKNTPILSYAIKYASALFSPFRQAAEGAPQFGDRSTYQIDYANSNESLRECALDVNEGADMLMVKPAHTYLDVIWRVKEAYPGLPLCGYHTSGEFAMIKAASANGWIDEKKVVTEVLTAIQRAGADFTITYYAKEFLEWLKG